MIVWQLFCVQKDTLGKYKKNIQIENLDQVINNEKNQIFHAGTIEKNNKIFSDGGRVINVTSLGNNLEDTRTKCLDNLNKIGWKEGFFRKDIGWRVIEKKWG